MRWPKSVGANRIDSVSEFPGSIGGGKALAKLKSPVTFTSVIVSVAVPVLVISNSLS